MFSDFVKKLINIFNLIEKLFNSYDKANGFGFCLKLWKLILINIDYAIQNPLYIYACIKFVMNTLNIILEVKTRSK